MRIQSINNNYQSNISHKAYFKPNAHFNKLFGEQALVSKFSMDTLKKFNKLPNHELEILNIISRDDNITTGKINCTVFNNTTKKTLTFMISKTQERFDTLLEHFCRKDPIIEDFFQKDYDKVVTYISLTRP